MRVYVHFSSKFLNINFQYLKTKIYFYSLKTCISSFVEVIERRGDYSSLFRAPSSVNLALHISLYLVIWYWCSCQFYNIVNVNYIFTVTTFFGFKWKRKFNLLKALSALRNTFSSWHSRSIFCIHFSIFLII